jgi:hypothetical protein
MADIDTKTNGDKFDTAYGDRITTAADFFAENSRTKSNGVREVPKAAFFKELDKHGVTESDVKKVSEALSFVRTAGAELATRDLEAKIGEATPDQLGDAAFRRGLSATVRLPTPEGSTDLTLYAESVNNIPFRGDGDGGEPQTKTTYGRLKATVNTKMHIHRNFLQEADDRMRKALGVAAAAKD